MIEVELKFRLRNKTRLIDQLIKDGYKAAKALHQVDKVFIVKSNSLKDFKVGDPVTRLRTVNGTKTFLTYKRAIDNHDVRIEHEMEVSPAAQARALLTEMGYKPVATVDKQRVEYCREEVTITIDEVKSLGSFAEIEIVCQEGKQTAALEKIKKIAGRFGLEEKDLEPLKYDQLVDQLPGQD